MMGAIQEAEVWRNVCYQSRREHELHMTVLSSGQWPGTSTQTKSVKVLRFLEDRCDWLTVEQGSWVRAVEHYAEQARREGGLAIGAIMVGVMPEKRDGKLELKPALITVVTGVGLCDGRRFDISHRFEEESDGMVFYGPLSMEGQGTLAATGWDLECGMEGILIGPWPKRLPCRVSSGGEGLTK
jgi:hypothetical protein